MHFSYNSSLVAISLAVAILGSFTGLVLTTGIHRVTGAEMRLRLFLAGLGVGGGIWSMHFIAMLAVVLPIELSYDAPRTIVSAIIAIIATTLALTISARKLFGTASLIVSALVLGSGIAAMHYLGMSAIRGACGVSYSSIGIAISIAIAIQASAIALWFAFRRRGVLDTFVGSVALGLAIALMHYSAMEGTSFLPARPNFDNTMLILSQKYLAVAVAVSIYSVCGVCLFVFSALTLRARRLR